MKNIFPQKFISRSVWVVTWLNQQDFHTFERKYWKMSSESLSTVSSILSSIETEFDESRTLNDDLVNKLFDELMKFENGAAAVKEFTWLFGIGEKERHMVEAKECRKVFLIDFKTCRKFLNKFTAQQDWNASLDQRKFNWWLTRRNMKKKRNIIQKTVEKT